MGAVCACNEDSVSSPRKFDEPGSRRRVQFDETVENIRCYDADGMGKRRPAEVRAERLKDPQVEDHPALASIPVVDLMSDLMSEAMSDMHAVSTEARKRQPRPRNLWTSSVARSPRRAGA
eukprot:TRINITY_DN8062_c0_g1_i1.p3 TRINITY_DN8062_c0_g1~~TRINITY_DN8062_c0_g1_i1.p3  ORF type:complete len:120 (-),score=19.63 TRINITY_DN8062_c0_g1_i1:613-972(-)